MQCVNVQAMPKHALTNLHAQLVFNGTLQQKSLYIDHEGNLPETTASSRAMMT